VPEHPHWYCLRDWVLEGAEFDWFVDLIAKYGYEGRFWGQVWPYLDLRDGFKYWQSETIDRSGGLIINRARLDQVRLEVDR
jgi:hypothetical protein